MGEKKRHYGMTNFGEYQDQENDDDESEISMPDEVFEQISNIYFNEVYAKFIDELKEVKQELKEIKEELRRLKC